MFTTGFAGSSRLVSDHRFRINNVNMFQWRTIRKKDGKIVRGISSLVSLLKRDNTITSSHQILGDWFFQSHHNFDSKEIPCHLDCEHVWTVPTGRLALIYSLQSSTCLGRNSMSTCPSRHREMDNIRSTWITQLQVLNHDIWSLTLSPNNLTRQVWPYVKNAPTKNQNIPTLNQHYVTVALKATNPAELWDTLSMANQKGHAIRALLCFVWEAPVNCTCFFWFFRCLDPCDSFRMVGLVSEHPRIASLQDTCCLKVWWLHPEPKTRRHAKDNHLHLWNWMTEWLENQRWFHWHEVIVRYDLSAPILREYQSLRYPNC